MRGTTSDTPTQADIGDFLDRGINTIFQITRYRLPTSKESEQMCESILGPIQANRSDKCVIDNSSARKILKRSLTQWLDELEYFDD